MWESGRTMHDNADDYAADADDDDDGDDVDGDDDDDD